MADDVDIVATGLLGGLTGSARAERQELVGWLLDRDFTVEQIRVSLSPILLPAGRIVGRDGDYVSLRQICAETGTDPLLLRRLLRAVGLPQVDDPDAEVHLRADGQVAVRAKEFIDAGFGEEGILSVLRVLSDGLNHAAESMRAALLSAAQQPGASELQVAQSYEALTRAGVGLLGPLMEAVLGVALRHSLEVVAVNSAQAASSLTPGAREVAVAFADVVGFTEMGEALSPEELERVASRLSDLARDVAVVPVRLVKTIGDAVMLVCPDPVRLLDAVLDLSDAADGDGFPLLRIGMAWGLAVNRAGDWFGSPVNLASRVTGSARPGAVLVAGPARDVIGEHPGFVWSFAGARRLKGIRDDVKLFRARRAAPGTG